MKADCTIYKTLDVIGKKWSLVIILELSKGKNNTKQYSVLKSSLSTITPKVLSSRLKELENYKLISKKIDTSSSPAHTFYSLTKSSVELLTILKDMKSWALKFNIKSEHCGSTNCKDCPF